MTLFPVPSPRHADPTLQPSYFTSSLYTEALRQDIVNLVAAFQEAYTYRGSESPFGTFKYLWRTQRWHLLHLRVFDDRTREKFLNVTCRLFLEKTKKQELPFTRIVALLSLYSFYAAQPLNTVPSLWCLKHVPIPLDQFRDLHALEKDLASSELKILAPTVTYVLRYFLENGVFIFLPFAKLCPENPRSLPRESYIDQGKIGPAATKKKGRPNRNDKTRKAKTTMDNLESWLENTRNVVEPALPNASTSMATPTVDGYRSLKARLLDAISSQGSQGRSIIANANQHILQRLNDLRGLVPEESVSCDGPTNAGVSRVKDAMEDLEGGRNRGVLELLDGSRKR